MPSIYLAAKHGVDIAQGMRRRSIPSIYLATKHGVDIAQGMRRRSMPSIYLAAKHGVDIAQGMRRRSMPSIYLATKHGVDIAQGMRRRSMPSISPLARSTALAIRNTRVGAGCRKQILILRVRNHLLVRTTAALRRVASSYFSPAFQRRVRR